MKRAFEEWGYRITMRGDWIGDWFARLWFRWYCPYPLHRNWTARHCIKVGDCGCENSRRER